MSVADLAFDLQTGDERRQTGHHARLPVDDDQAVGAATDKAEDAACQTGCRVNRQDALTGGEQGTGDGIALDACRRGAVPGELDGRTRCMANASRAVVVHVAGTNGGDVSTSLDMTG